MASLPLNLVALIIQQLDGVADLARLCRTSRILNYMALPQLYKNVVLSRRAYDNGCHPGPRGHISPFARGLNTLVSRNVGPLVTSLVLQDDESTAHAHDRPHKASIERQTPGHDDGLFLNLAVRAALDRCVALQAFTWALLDDQMPTLFHGLAQLRQLRSLHIQSRGGCHITRNLGIVLPNLVDLTLSDWAPADPYLGDGFSTILLHATELEVLNISCPRETQEKGPETLRRLFHDLRKSKKQLRLKRLGLYNIGRWWDGDGLHDVLNPGTLEALSLLNYWDPEILHEAGDAAINPWILFGKFKHLKSVRYDELDLSHARFLNLTNSLEELYLVAEWHQDESRIHGHEELRNAYMDVICTNHGAKLRKLIFPACWPLPMSTIARLFRACPNITQLSLAMDCSNMEGMRMLVPFLKKLYAIRMAMPRDAGGAVQQKFEKVVDSDLAFQEGMMETELAAIGDFPELRYVGLGDEVWECGSLFKQDGVSKRKIRRLGLEQVKDVDLWKMAHADKRWWRERW